MKEIKVNDVVLLEYDNDEIYKNERRIFILNGIAAIFAIIIATTYLITNTLKNAWVLNWIYYAYHVMAILMPVAFFLSSLGFKLGVRPSRFTDKELARMVKRYKLGFKPSKKAIDHFPLASSIFACFLPIIFQIVYSFLWGAWINNSIVIVFRFLGETFLSYIFVYISTIICIINGTLRKKEWDANPPTFAQSAIKAKEEERAKAEYEKKKAEYKILIEKCGIRFFIKYHEQIQLLPLRDVIVTEIYDSADRKERLTAAKEIVDRGMTEFTLREILNEYSGILEEKELEKIRAKLFDNQKEQMIKQGDENNV